MLTNAAAAGQVRVEDYPDEVHLSQGLTLPLSYAFAPGSAEDGVTVDVPLAVLDGVAARTSGESLAFTVPGLREELVTALLRTLPKQVRRALVPIPDRVREVLPRIDPGEPLLPALERELRRSAAVVDHRPTPGPRPRCPTTCARRSGCSTTSSARWPSERTSPRSRRRSRPKARASLARAAADVERTGLTTWDFGTLPRTVEVQRGAHVVTAYPALVDEGETVGVRVVAHRGGGAAAGLAGRPAPARARRRLPGQAGGEGRCRRARRLALQFNPDGEIPDLVADCVDAAADELIAAAGGPPRDEAAFAALVDDREGASCTG